MFPLRTSFSIFCWILIEGSSEAKIDPLIKFNEGIVCGFKKVAIALSSTTTDIWERLVLNSTGILWMYKVPGPLIVQLSGNDTGVVANVYQVRKNLINSKLPITFLDTTAEAVIANAPLHTKSLTI